MWIALLAALAVAAPGLVVRDAGPAVAAAPPVDRFVPPVERIGDRAVVPLVFTDGTRARLSYPARLTLAEPGVEPYTSATLRGGDDRDFQIRYARVEELATGWRRLGEYAGARGGRVGFWDSGPGADDLNHLAFQFGPWAVLVYDYPPEFDGGDAAMSDADRAAWARSPRGRVTRAGFLRLHGFGRLRLARAGEHAGPQLAFGGRPGRVTLYPGRCRRSRHHDTRMFGRWVSWNRRNANWCLTRSMRADATGAAGDRRALIRGLRIRR